MKDKILEEMNRIITDVKLAELHIKPLEQWNNEEWMFFAANKDRVVELVKSGYLDGFIPHK